VIKYISETSPREKMNARVKHKDTLPEPRNGGRRRSHIIRKLRKRGKGDHMGERREDCLYQFENHRRADLALTKEAVCRSKKGIRNANRGGGAMNIGLCCEKGRKSIA